MPFVAIGKGPVLKPLAIADGEKSAESNAMLELCGDRTGLAGSIGTREAAEGAVLLEPLAYPPVVGQLDLLL